MNKKLKFLSSVICGLALSSGIALTSVQAAPVKTNRNSGISIKAIIPNDTYSVYCKLSGSACNDICKYVKSNGNLATANGLRDVLVQGGYLSKTTANAVALSLFSLVTETERVGFPEIAGTSDGIDVLQPAKQQGAFDVTDSSTDGSVSSYCIYAILSPEDTKVIKTYIDNNKGVISPSKLAEFLINNGITSDYNTSINIARAIYTVDYINFDALADMGKSILILSDNNNAPYYHLARVAR